MWLSSLLESCGLSQAQTELGSTSTPPFGWAAKLSSRGRLQTRITCRREVSIVLSGVGEQEDAYYALNSSGESAHISSRAGRTVAIT